MVLIYEKRNGIAYLTLNRPEARNAVDPELAVELAAAWEAQRAFVFKRDFGESKCDIADAQSLHGTAFWPAPPLGERDHQD